MSPYRRRRTHIYLATALFLCLSLGGVPLGSAEGMDAMALNGAMERLGAADSLTIRMQAALAQNGVNKLTGDVLCQADKERAYLHATFVDSEGKSRDIEIASSNGITILRNGDAYDSMPEKQEHRAVESSVAPETMTVDRMRKGLKKLIGSAADRLTITDDGASLHLTMGEIPFSLGLAIGFMDGYELKGADANADGFSLSLGYGLYIDHIDLDIPLAGGDIRDMKMEVALGGRSKDGVSLITILRIDFAFSDIGTTIPGSIEMADVALTPFE